MYHFITEKFGSSSVRVRFEFGSSSMIKVRVRVRFDEIEKFEVRSFTNPPRPKESTHKVNKSYYL